MKNTALQADGLLGQLYSQSLYAFKLARLSWVDVAVTEQGQCAGTSLTYAEWAPLAPLTDSGLIRACTYFLNTQDFRMLACDTLKQISHRRQDKVICTCLCMSQLVCACFGHLTAAVAGCTSFSSAA